MGKKQIKTKERVRDHGEAVGGFSTVLHSDEFESLYGGKVPKIKD